MTQVTDKYRLHNMDRAQSACFGGEPSDFDTCQVYECPKDAPCIHKDLRFTGTKRECYEFIRGERPAMF